MNISCLGFVFKALEYFPQLEDVKVGPLSIFQECTSQVGSGAPSMRAPTTNFGLTLTHSHAERAGKKNDMKPHRGLRDIRGAAVPSGKITCTVSMLAGSC